MYLFDRFWARFLWYLNASKVLYYRDAVAETLFVGGFLTASYTSKV